MCLRDILLRKNESYISAMSRWRQTLTPIKYMSAWKIIQSRVNPILSSQVVSQPFQSVIQEVANFCAAMDTLIDQDELTLKVLNFWKFTSYCNLRPLWSGHGGSSAGSYLADPTSPIPSHCASIVVTSTVRVKRFTVSTSSPERTWSGGWCHQSPRRSCVWERSRWCRGDTRLHGLGWLHRKEADRLMPKDSVTWRTCHLSMQLDQSSLWQRWPWLNESNIITAQQSHYAPGNHHASHL